MVRDLIHDPIFLTVKSSPADISDLDTARDLLDTLRAHKENCVGMAANMIGVQRRIIAFLDGSSPFPYYTVMLNPHIVKKDSPYFTEESCLSLLGGPRKCTRYEHITVEFQTMELTPQRKDYHGWTAQIIQHEVDHCEGILI